MKRTLIQNAVVVNEGRKVLGSVVIENEKIAEILVGGENATAPCDEIIDATGCYLLPGAIDEHVHFRDPGQTYKESMISGFMSTAPRTDCSASAENGRFLTSSPLISQSRQGLFFRRSRDKA